MCGRYNIATSANALLAFFEIEQSPVNPAELKPRYNVAPSQQIPVVPLADGARELTPIRWGLLPSWAEADKAQ
ncbi:MAG: SOS response-associated peptidase family protein [Thiotrichales bacterium]